MSAYQTLNEESFNKLPVYRELWSFVKTAHGTQRRKTEMSFLFIPYYFHPLKVLELVLNAQMRPVDQSLNDPKNLPLHAGALLHDVMEDTSFNTISKLADALRPFMPSHHLDEVIDITAELTNPFGLTTENKKQWQVNHAEQMPFKAKLIKMADQISNIYDTYHLPQPWDFEKKCCYLDKAMAVHRACLKGTENCPEMRSAFEVMDEIGSRIYLKAIYNFRIRHNQSNDFFRNVCLKGAAKTR